MPHRLRKPPRIWAPEASLRGSYTRFIDFSTPFFDFGPLPHDHFGHKNVVITGNVNKPSHFCSFWSSKYDVPRLTAAARSLQLVTDTIVL